MRYTSEKPFSVSSAATSKKFDENMDRMFGLKCGMHPEFDGNKEPERNCLRCWRYYESKKESSR